ncbi:hypothetical protein M409DRAFT_69063 [Zasmidium cellare ATCC 36951]|uniref:Uncharacterized protein n=1 Tax=Zasmidium cellare ATCC 36951 TaxID=1080233 RepID=A0A6A6C5R9_ZASCE|nr:uncharacterized protein M409DRAFT_69063 [Zasmidium cellare ATCC 36951]KAF2162454.1 hypothetical protein M409DRAFT_69063 [Zasmidium cellare ATCC 36951]
MPALSLPVAALPTAQPSSTIVPGQTLLYNNYSGVAPPFPGNVQGASLPTACGKPGPDDVLWQNLLAAEWIVFSFYQQAVERFDAASFTSLDLPNTTFERIIEIRDNEAGHLNAFYDQISNASTKPGPCSYDFGVTAPGSWLALQVLIEVSLMAFLTGLAQEAKLPSTGAALVAVAEVESRHNTWALIEAWNLNPFSGPIDTAYPYADQILASTNAFVVNGSCPKENPPYPYPNQHLPALDWNRKNETGHTGTDITFTFTEQKALFDDDGEYFAVFFHALANISVPFDPKKRTSRVPADFDAGKGIVIAVIADQWGAPTKESCVTAPLILLQQPGSITQLV